MKKILGLSMAVIMIASCAVGCGKKDDSKKDSKSNYVGKWEPEKLVYGEEEMTDFFGLPLAALAQYELKDDGTCTLFSILDESASDGEGKTGTWSEDGDKVSINFPDEDGKDDIDVFEYKDGKLVLEDDVDGEKDYIYLIKVDEFTSLDLDELLGEDE